MKNFSVLRSVPLIHLIFLVLVVPQAQNAPADQRNTFVDELKLLSTLKGSECKFPPPDVLQSSSPWYKAINNFCEDNSAADYMTKGRVICSLLNRSVEAICSMKKEPSETSTSTSAVFPVSYKDVIKTMEIYLSSTKVFCEALNSSITERDKNEQDFFQMDGQNSCTKLCKDDTVTASTADADSEGKKENDPKLEIHPVCILTLQARQIMKASGDSSASGMGIAPVESKANTLGAGEANLLSSFDLQPSVPNQGTNRTVGLSKGSDTISSSTLASVSSATSDNGRIHSLSAVPVSLRSSSVSANKSVSQDENAPKSDDSDHNSGVKGSTLETEGPSVDGEGEAGSIPSQPHALVGSLVTYNSSNSPASTILISGSTPSASQTDNLPLGYKKKKNFLLNSPNDGHHMDGTTDLKSSNDGLLPPLSMPSQSLLISNAREQSVPVPVQNESQNNSNNTVTKNSDKSITTQRLNEGTEEQQPQPENSSLTKVTDNTDTAAEKSSVGHVISGQVTSSKGAVDTTGQNLNHEESSLVKLSVKDSTPSSQIISSNANKDVSAFSSTVGLDNVNADSKVSQSSKSSVNPNQNVPPTKENVGSPNIETPGAGAGMDEDYGNDFPSSVAKNTVDKDGSVGNLNLDNDEGETKYSEEFQNGGQGSKNKKVTVKNSYISKGNFMDTSRVSKERTNINEDFRASDDGEDVGFFNYFLSFMAICGFGFLLLHNKKRIIAMVVEGRRPRTARRRSSSGTYRKLENNFD